MKSDSAGQALIKSFESLRLKAYLDSAEHWTIGWGHRIEDGTNAPDWTPQEAEDAFQKDISFNNGKVSSFLFVPYSQDQFNALVSFAFNMGAEKLRTSTLIRIINTGDWLGASKEILKWCHIHNRRTGEVAVVNGLLARRTKESELLAGSINKAKTTAIEV